jgi:hypothetical protein
MVDMPIKLSVIWVCVMLTYLLGDVLRIFSSDSKVGEMGSKGGMPSMELELTRRSK